MLRIARRLRHDQFLATIAVIIVAAITFGLLALLAGNERSNVETQSRLDDLQSYVYRLGAIHGAVATSDVVNDAEIVTFERLRIEVATALTAFESRVGDTAEYRDLAERFNRYIAAIDAMIVCCTLRRCARSQLS